MRALLSLVHERERVVVQTKKRLKTELGVANEASLLVRVLWRVAQLQKGTGNVTQEGYYFFSDRAGLTLCKNCTQPGTV